MEQKMIEIKTKLLEDLGACSKAIEWHKKQKTTSFNKLFKLCQKENHLDWAYWLITVLLDSHQLTRFTVYASKKILHQYKKENRYNSSIIPGLEDYLEDIEAIDWAQSAIYAAMGELSRQTPLVKILKYGIRLLKETQE